jgi:acetyltransferase-like isoleucine patch superfamily enzyme
MHLTVGRGTTINHGCTIDCRADVSIGEGYGVANGVSLITASHEWDDPQRRAGEETFASIRSGDGVLIGSNAVVLPGVSIGDGCVMG